MDSNRPFENLANAIILQAVKDYKKALKTDNKKSLKELRSFFASQWYEALTSVDPGRLMHGVEILVQKELAESDARKRHREAQKLRDSAEDLLNGEDPIKILTELGVISESDAAENSIHITPEKIVALARAMEAQATELDEKHAALFQEAKRLEKEAVKSVGYVYLEAKS